MVSLSKIFKQAVFVVTILIVTMTAAELSFRALGYQGNQFRSILFGDDANSVLLFEQSPLLWWKLRKNVVVTFLGKKVATNSIGLRIGLYDNTRRDDNNVRILCLGDSSTFGWGLDYNQTYPFLLEQRLRRTLGSVQVYNGGVPGYTSFQSILLFEEIADRVQPDAVVLYSSNNENSLAQHPDLERFNAASRMLWLRLWLNRSLTYQFLKGALIRAKPFKITGTISLNQLSKLSVRVSLAEYRENLIQTIKLARRKGIALLLVTVPSHIGHPYLFNVPAKDFEVNALLGQVEERVTKGQYESALADLEKAQRLVPDYYKIHFLRGKLFQLMEKNISIAEYEKALECHPFPERLKRSYNNILLRTADDHNVPVVNLYKAFRDHPLSLDKLFMDGCHPSPLGQELIAELLTPPILKMLNMRD